jgi:hypothetical protein
VIQDAGLAESGLAASTIQTLEADMLCTVLRYAVERAIGAQ